MKVSLFLFNIKAQAAVPLQGSVTPDENQIRKEKIMKHSVSSLLKKALVISMATACAFSFTACKGGCNNENEPGPGPDPGPGGDEDVVVTELVIDTPPTTLEYYVGEAFNPAGMIVKAKWSDGLKSGVSLSDCTFTPAGPLSVSDTEVTVTYSSVSAKQPITVKDVAITSIEVDTGKMQLSGAAFTPIDFSQVKVIAHYDDGNQKVLTGGYTFSVGGKEIEDITNVIFEEGGSVEVVVTYGTQSDLFTMEIFKGFIIEAENFKRTADITEEDKNFVEQVSGAFGTRNAATASGGQYLGQIFRGNVMRFHAYAEQDCFANIILWASSCYMLVDGGSWEPLKMGDMQFNRVFEVKYGTAEEAAADGLKELEVDDDVILPGGETDDPEIGQLYTNWKDVSFGNIPLYEGDNIIELTVISDYVNCKGEKVACNIDRFEVQYTDHYIPPAQVELLEIKTAPDKTTYIAGETFDITGMEILAHMDDGTTKNASLSQCTVEPEGALEAGTTEVTITYKEKTVKQAITVLTVESLTIETPPAKTAYLVGETFSATGMVIKATLSNSTEINVNISDCVITPNGALEAGTTEVTISYSGKEVKQAITVNASVLVMEAENVISNPTETDKNYTEVVRYAPGRNNIVTESNDAEAYGTSGGKHLNNLYGSADGQSGAKIRFHINSESAGKAVIKMYASSCYNKEYKGNTWYPYIMGDSQLNQLYAVRFGATADALSNVTIDDNVIVEGGTRAEGSSNGYELWENWKEVVLGEFDFVAGDNILELENINSTIKDVEGKIIGLHIDKLVIEYVA